MKANITNNKHWRLALLGSLLLIALGLFIGIPFGRHRQNASIGKHVPAYSDQELQEFVNDIVSEAHPKRRTR